MKKRIIAVSAVLAIAIAGFVIWAFSCKKDGNFEFLSPKEASAAAMEVLGSKYENFIISDDIDIDVKPIDELYTFKADLSSNCDKLKQADKLAELMIPGIELISSEEQDPGTITKWYKFGDVEASVYYCDDSTFVFGRTEHSGTETLDVKCRKYVIGRDDLSQSYNLNGEQYSVEDAVRYAERFSEEKLMPFFPNDSGVEAEAATVLQMDNGNYWISVQLRHYMHGCPVSTSGSAIMGEAFMRPEQLILTFDGKNDICHIKNNCYSTVAESKKLKKIISLRSALKHLEKTLAPGLNYSISRISLEYCARIEDINNFEFEYHPMWTMIVAEGTPSGIKPYPRTTIYVDAVNGEICCFSDSENRMIF